MKNYLTIIRTILIFFYNSFFRCNVLSKTIPIKVKIGKSSKIAENSDIDKHSKIGNYCFIAQGVIITKSTIGNYSSIAPNVKVGLGEHDYNNISTSVRFIENAYDELTKKECSIGNDVWIGTGAAILRGVKIGDGAVIGANAVVTKDIPPFAIAVGVPAKVIKYRFSAKKINIIIESKWWEFPVGKAKKIIQKIEDE